MFSLLYVSRSLLDADRTDGEIASIVAVSTGYNLTASITGALIFTGDRFAQALEGREDAVLDLMDSISRDARHTDVTIVQQGPALRRRFEGWSMVYSGRSTYAARMVERIWKERADLDGLAAQNLIRLLRQLSISGVQQPDGPEAKR